MAYNISLLNKIDRLRFGQTPAVHRVEDKPPKPPADRLFNNRKDVVSLHRNSGTLQKNQVSTPVSEIGESPSKARFEKTLSLEPVSTEIIDNGDYQKIGRKLKNLQGLSSKALSQYELMPSEFIYPEVFKS